MSVLQQALHDGTFACIMEFVPKPSAARFDTFQRLMAGNRLCGWPMLAAVADRVGGRLDLSPLDTVASFDPPIPSLVHFSGKDREPHDLLAQLARMDAAGLRQLLVLTGDRLPGHEPGSHPVRYLESVAALQLVRQARPDWLLGAALNPFKYHEEEGGAQYFKAHKKLAAGADFLTLQLGFDADKHLEAQTWMARQPSPKPLLACVMGLTLGRAKMLEHVAGVVLTPSMRAVLEAEDAVSKAYAQARSVERLAIQIVGLKLMGYAGIHLSGIHDAPQLAALDRQLTLALDALTTREQWAEAWQASWRMPDLPAVTFHPPGAHWRLGEHRVTASSGERWRYRLLSGLHDQVFLPERLVGRMAGWAVGRPVWKTATGAQWLHRLERGLKRPVVGCDTCGSCRLHDTLYVCPETCPKGLANGPCGGTQLNRCEFGDRECVHGVKYRIAVSTGQTAVLTDRLIPCVEVEGRQRSSWPGWFG